MAQGRWLAGFHEAGKKFTKDHPEIASKFDSWDTIHGGVQKKALTPPDIPETEKTFGLLHGDFHRGNYHLTKDA